MWKMALSVVVGTLFGAQAAWGITITCTVSGVGNPGCQTDPAFPNTCYTPGTSENEPVNEQTQTLTFVGKTLLANGSENILDSDGITVSDQINFVHAVGGDQVIFDSDPGSGGTFPPVAGATDTGTEGIDGIVLLLPLDFSDGTQLFLKVGSDGENLFNPINIAGGINLSDFLQIVPEPISFALLAMGLLGVRGYPSPPQWNVKKTTPAELSTAPFGGGLHRRTSDD